MSKDDALAFIAKVGDSPELQARINALRGSGVLAQLSGMGAELGYTFSEEEYRDAVASLADGELSEESLDEVLRETGLK